MIAKKKLYAWPLPIPDIRTARWTPDAPPTRFHTKPFPQPHPPIAMTALSPGSSTLTIAGARGYLPACIGLGNGYLRDNWQMVKRAAAGAGRPGRPGLAGLSAALELGETLNSRA